MVIEKQISFLRFLILSQWKVEPAHRASVVVLKPWLQTTRVEDVAAGHEHAFAALVDVVEAHCATRRLQFVFNFLTVLFINFYNGQSVYSFLFRSLGSLPSLGFLLANSTYHLENGVRGKVLVIVMHKVVWVEVAVGSLHPCELVPREYIQEATEQVIHDILYVTRESFLIRIRFSLTRPCRSRVR